MYTKRTAYTLAAVSTFVIILSVVAFHGQNSRVYASQSIQLVVDSPEKTFTLWQEKKVKGRVLFLFDNYPHLRGRYSYYGGSYELTKSNFIELGVFQNIIREIYFIVPDDAWEEFRKNEMIHPIRPLPGLERGLFLYSINGLPIIATTPTSLPQLSETVLVYVNGSIYKDTEARELLKLKKITSDIFVTYQGPR